MTASQSTSVCARRQLSPDEKDCSEPPMDAVRVARFWSKVDVRGPGGCWMWTAGVNKKGYGLFGAGGNRSCLAHRIAFLLDTGVWAGRLYVLHHCDTPGCCNAQHLFLGTQVENMADMVAKGRAAKGETSGLRRHPECIPRGERSGSAKLTEAQVREMRRRYAAGGVRHRDLAEERGMDTSSVTRIINRQVWKHVS